MRLRRAVNYALDRPALAAAFHDSAGRPDRPADRRRLPVRGVLSRLRGPASPPPGSSQATARSTPCSTTARSSPTATPASTRSRRIVKATSRGSGSTVSIVRVDECPRTYDARHEPRRPPARDELRHARPRSRRVSRPRAGARPVPLGARARTVEQPVVPEPPRARTRRCAARPGPPCTCASSVS